MQTEPSIHMRKRLPREERERLIVDEAIRFFSEVGFEGQTRALAERLGVTQPLLYRYFPDKDSLIERVFEEVYVKLWRDDWVVLLKDRSRPLVERLVDFYKDFCEAIFKPEWVRIFMFAGLKGEAVNSRYLASVRANILEVVAAELRHECGMPLPEELPVDELEINMIWAVHGAIFHIALRKWIYKVSVPDDINFLVECTVRAFMQGSGEALRRVLATRLV